MMAPVKDAVVVTYPSIEPRTPSSLAGAEAPLFILVRDETITP